MNAKLLFSLAFTAALCVAWLAVVTSFRTGPASHELAEARYESEMLRICWGGISAPPYEGRTFTDDQGREGCYVTENGRPVLALLRPSQYWYERGGVNEND